MPDNLRRRGPEDPKKININQSWEIDYWTEKLNISEKTLKLAVGNAGPMVNNVKAWLRSKGYS